MYKKNADGQNGNSSDKELIDISSDDEGSRNEATSSGQIKERKESHRSEESKDSKQQKVRKGGREKDEERRARDEPMDFNKEVKRNPFYSTPARSATPKSSNLEADLALSKSVRLRDR